MNWSSPSLSEVNKNKIWRERTMKLEGNLPLKTNTNVGMSMLDSRNILSKPISVRTHNFLDKTALALGTITKYLGEEHRDAVMRSAGMRVPTPPTVPKLDLKSHTNNTAGGGGALTARPPPPPTEYDRKVTAALHRRMADPISKYDTPQTSSQEVGWALPQLPQTARTHRPRIGQPNFKRQKHEHGTYLEYAIRDGQMRSKK
eukprot:PhM_4_TR2605/c0_g1_i1/m.67930